MTNQDVFDIISRGGTANSGIIGNNNSNNTITINNYDGERSEIIAELTRICTSLSTRQKLAILTYALDVEAQAQGGAK